MDMPPLDAGGLKARTDALREQAQALTPREQLLTHALEELGMSMEELRVAEEELRVQNEALEEMRGDLEHQVERYRDLFDQAPDAYLVTDTVGTIQEANRAAAALLGVGERLLVGRSLLQFVAPEDRPQISSKVLRVAPGEAPTRGATPEHSLRLLARGGEIPMTLKVTAARGRKGHSEGLRWLFRDATAAGLAEEERYRLVVQELDDYAVILMDDAGRVLTWNKGAENVFGYTPEEIVGRQAAFLYTPEDRAQGAEARERETARAAGRAEDERWHQKRDGTRFWGSGVLTQLSGSNTRARFAKIVRDMTARKQAEDRMQSDYVREHRISHTLQNALLPEFPEDAFPGFAVAAFYEPAWDEARVGGDFYDIIRLQEDRIAFVVGDVAGKGLGAAARTGEIKAGLRAFLREDSDPASALTRLNALVCDSERLDGVVEHLLLVAAVAVADARTGDVQFASAGLEPPIVVKASGVTEAVPVQGLTLGVKRDTDYQVTEQRLDPGDLLIMVTDGLTEARQDRRFLGHDGLMSIVQTALPLRSPAAIGGAVLAEVRRFTSGSTAQNALRDDACLLLACRLPGQAEGNTQQGAPS